MGRIENGIVPVVEVVGRGDISVVTPEDLERALRIYNEMRQKFLAPRLIEIEDVYRERVLRGRNELGFEGKLENDGSGGVVEELYKIENDPNVVVQVGRGHMGKIVGLDWEKGGSINVKIEALSAVYYPHSGNFMGTLHEETQKFPIFDPWNNFGDEDRGILGWFRRPEGNKNKYTPRIVRP